MKEGAKLQKQILETKLKNCQKSLEDLQKKRKKLDQAEEEIQSTLEKLTKQIENFGKKKESDSSSKEEKPKQIQDSEDLQKYLETLSPEQRENISPSWIELNPSVDEVKDFLKKIDL